MHLQGSATGSSPPTMTITNVSWTGAREPSTTQFAGSGSAAALVSTEADVSPAIALFGDGHGRVGTWEWDRFGNDALDTGWVALTAPTGWSANSVMYRVQHGQFLSVKVDGFKNAAVAVGADGGIIDEVFTGIPTWYRLADTVSAYFKIFWGLPASIAVNTAGEVRIVAAESTGTARSIALNTAARGQTALMSIPAVRSAPAARAVQMKSTARAQSGMRASG